MPDCVHVIVASAFRHCLSTFQNATVQEDHSFVNSVYPTPMILHFVAASNCADLLTFSVYKTCDSAQASHQFTLSNSTTRLLHNDLLRCCYSRTLLLSCSCPAPGYSCQWRWCCPLVSHVFDVHDVLEPIYDDLPAVHHPQLDILPSDLHSQLDVLSSILHPLSDDHPLFADDHTLSDDHPISADDHPLSTHYSLFIIVEALLSTDHHPIRHHHPLCVVHHPLCIVHHSLFVDDPLFEAELHMLPVLHTLPVLDAVPVRARRRR
jgi:hypothetical protein